MTHEELREMLGAYALDALDEAERRTMESHLVACAECAGEAAEHREVAGFLAGGWMPAPEGVWEQISDSMVETPPPGPVIDLRRARARRRRSPWPLVGVAAAMFAALVIGGLTARVVQDEQRFRDITSALAGDELTQAVNAAAVHPDVVKVALRTAQGDVGAQALLLPDGSGYLLAEDLPMLAEDQTYQLWGVVGTTRVSLGLLGPDPQPSAFRVVGDVSALALTAESRGGVAVSQQEPVALGAVGSVSA